MLMGTASVVLMPGGAAHAHEERPASFPSGDGEVPAYRPYPAPRHLVVCRPDTPQRIASYTGELRERNVALLAQCRFHSIQDAVNAVNAVGTAKSTIYVMPGVYTEGKYARLEPAGECANLSPASDPGPVGTLPGLPPADAQRGGQTPVAISYADQRRCPHNLNLIAVLGDRTPDNGSIACDSALCGLQIEGTGARPSDVLVDNRFAKLNAIRADRAGGLVLRNFTVQRAEFNSVYVIETDGLRVEHMVARANDEYGFLAFASDHGLFQHNEAYYNGDSGIYPGSAADINADNPALEVTRYAIEIRRNRLHHNALGYSGTAGNSVFLHHNLIWDNATGVATDSLFPNHPGLPQDHARFSHNRIWSNNVNYYERYVDTGVCARPIEQRGYLRGVVCPAIPLPVGSGILIAGGNFNSVDHNIIYDNWRFGAMQFWVPAPLRNDFDPAHLYDTSNHNHYVGNSLGVSPAGEQRPNGLDFWWDDEGEGNCWQDNVSSVSSASSHGEPTHNAVAPTGLPGCAGGGSLFTPGVPVKDAGFLTCTQYNKEDPVMRHPPGCTWLDSPAAPGGERASSPGVPDIRAPAAGSHGSGGAGLMAGGLSLLLAAVVARRRAQRRPAP
ncbi:MAG: right-handed parallel beta-helix repeat-containing protein [Streptomycetales bacterium]